VGTYEFKGKKNVGQGQGQKKENIGLMLLAAVLDFDRWQ
jgi:hypothetical protein